MNISVITFHRAYSYGAVLQAYATQKLLEKHKCEVALIDFMPEIDIYGLRLETTRMGSRWNKNAITRQLYSILKRPDYVRYDLVFNQFVNAYLSLSPRSYATIDELRTNPPTADMYCTGSDQVWNKDITQKCKEVFYLTFLPEGAKRISFSSSFGKAALSDGEKSETKQWLSKYAAISVREQSGLDILNNLGILNSVWLLDPTLLLTKQDWMEMIPARSIKQDYVLIFQLIKNKEFDHYARAFAKQKGLKLIRISTAYNHILKAGRLLYCPKVEEWLSLFCNAEYIITDSFHGTAFSINFNKKFVCVFPPHRTTRLESVLKLTGLTGRVLTDYDDFTIADKPIDYMRVNAILNAERKKADAFLINAIQDK